MSLFDSSRSFRSFRRYLADHNPFYLLSAASMLLACLLLSNTTTWSPIALNKLIALTATLSVYELLIVGLGLYLVAKRNLARDGVMLLALEAFFLADIGFLSSELYQESLKAGLICNAILFMLAVVKISAIFRVLRMPLRSPVFVLTLATVAMLLGHPAILKQLSDSRHGYVPELVLYIAWWILAGLCVCYGVAMRYLDTIAFRGAREGIHRAGIGHLIVCVLLASLVAHLSTAHWVFKCHFDPADFAMITLGLAAIVVSVPNSAFMPRPGSLRLGLMLLGISVVTASRSSHNLNLSVMSFEFTPLLLTVSASYLIVVYAYVAYRFFQYAAFGLAAAMAYAVAPSWASVQSTSGKLYQWVASVCDRLVPRTQAAWGAIALVGAFALLGVGALVSLFRPHDDEGDVTGSNAHPPLPAPVEVIADPAITA